MSGEDLLAGRVLGETVYTPIFSTGAQISIP